MVAEGDGLGGLQMCEARHNRTRVLLRQANDATLQAGDLCGDQVDTFAQM
jgi:hypothetical protein